MTALEESEVAVPIISAIVERTAGAAKKEILLQTRIAKYDKLYNGSIEIPAGRIGAFENVYETIKREVKEETGLDVIEIIPNEKSKIFTSGRSDASFAFQPYCCQQLLKGNIPWIGFVFIARVTEGKLKPARDETKDLRWTTIEELRKLVNDTPEKMFTLQLPVLDLYRKQQKTA